MSNQFITNLEESDIFTKAIMNLDKDDAKVFEEKKEPEFDDIEEFEDDFGEFDAMAEARKELRLDGVEDEERGNPWDIDEEEEDDKENDDFYNYEYLDDDEDKYGNPIKGSNKRVPDDEDEDETPAFNPFIGGLL